eukprot:339520-Chlamydomonas_euryale.AAC.1
MTRRRPSAPAARSATLSSSPPAAPCRPGAAGEGPERWHIWLRAAVQVSSDRRALRNQVHPARRPGELLAAGRWPLFKVEFRHPPCRGRRADWAGERSASRGAPKEERGRRGDSQALGMHAHTHARTHACMHASRHIGRHAPCRPQLGRSNAAGPMPAWRGTAR